MSDANPTEEGNRWPSLGGQHGGGVRPLRGRLEGGPAADDRGSPRRSARGGIARRCSASCWCWSWPTVAGPASGRRRRSTGRRFPRHVAVIDAVLGVARPGPSGLGPVRTTTCSSASWPCRTTSSTATSSWPPSTAWVADKSRPLGQILLDRGAVTAETTPCSRPWPAASLRRTAATPRTSLAALSSLGSIREDLEAPGRPRAPRQPRPRPQERGPGGLGRRAARGVASGRASAAAARGSASSGPQPGRPGRRLRRPRRRAAPRGGPEADPRPPRRRPGQPAAVPARGRDHRRAGAPGDRPGLRPGHLRRRPARTTPCGSSGATASRRPSTRFHADEALEARPGRAGRWSCASCCGGSSTSATRSTTPTAGACCTATSSRATSSSASTARRWWSTGAWPRPIGRAEPGAAADERTLRARRRPAASAETLPGAALGTPAYMSPEQAAGDLDRLGPRPATSTAWARRSTAC